MRFAPIALALLSSLALVAAIPHPAVTQADISNELNAYQRQLNEDPFHVGTGVHPENHPDAEKYYGTWARINSQEAAKHDSMARATRTRAQAGVDPQRNNDLSSMHHAAAEGNKRYAESNSAMLEQARKAKAKGKK